MKKLSVIVPAYKEEKSIYRNLGHLLSALDKIDIKQEVIVVCDGKIDKTYAQAKRNKDSRVKVVQYEKNMGKGYAIMYGLEQSTGDLVTFIDADMNLPPREIDRFIKLMDIYDSDIVIGSKRHPQSKVNYPILRRIQSFAYQILIKILFNLNVKDTQTGLKLFRRNVIKKVIPRIVVKRFAFDLEFLVVASHLGFDNILEAPVEIKQQFSSSTNLMSAYQALMDTAAIYYRLKFLKYYDKKPKKIQKFHHEKNFT